MAVSTSNEPELEVRLTLNCFMCPLRIRIVRVPQSFSVGALSYCPMCGRHATVVQDMDTDYLETLAAAYDMPTTLIKQFLEIWDWKEYNRFGDFIVAMKELVTGDGNKEEPS